MPSWMTKARSSDRRYSRGSGDEGRLDTSVAASSDCSHGLFPSGHSGMMPMNVAEDRLGPIRRLIRDAVSVTAPIPVLRPEHWLWHLARPSSYLFGHSDQIIRVYQASTS